MKEIEGFLRGYFFASWQERKYYPELNNILVQIVLYTVNGGKLTVAINRGISHVDGNVAIQAYDAALILQYVVGIIDHFPVEGKISESTDTINVTVVVEDNYFVFYADGDMIGFDLSIPNVSNKDIVLGTPELINWNDAILAYNNKESYRIGVASSEPVSSNSAFLKIPFTNIACNEVTFEMNINAEPYTVTLTIDHENPENNSPAFTNCLLGNYPNPFNPTTSIRFSIKDDNTPVEIKIYNIKGELVRIFHKDSYNAGLHNIKWNGRNNNGKFVSSGIYFNRITIGNHQFNGKMILLK